jgi:hypothetical protein
MKACPPNLYPKHGNVNQFNGYGLVGITTVAATLGCSVQAVSQRLAAGTMYPAPADHMDDTGRRLWRRSDLIQAVEQLKQATPCE